MGLEIRYDSRHLHHISSRFCAGSRSRSSRLLSFPVVWQIGDIGQIRFRESFTAPISVRPVHRPPSSANCRSTSLTRPSRPLCERYYIRHHHHCSRTSMIYNRCSLYITRRKILLVVWTSKFLWVKGRGNRVKRGQTHHVRTLFWAS